MKVHIRSFEGCTNIRKKFELIAVHSVVERQNFSNRLCNKLASDPKTLNDLDIPPSKNKYSSDKLRIKTPIEKSCYEL